MRSPFGLCPAIFAGLLTTALCAPARGVDWNTMLRDARSPDQADVNRFLDRELAAVCAEKADVLESEVPGLVDELNRKEDVVRVQASGLFYMIGQCRSDSEVVFARAIPALIEHVQDSARKASENSMRTLVELKPEVPAVAFSFLVQTMKGQDEHMAAMAGYGIARKALPGSEAENLLGRALLQNDSKARKQGAIGAILYARVSDPVLMTDLGAVLSDSDESVVKAALNAIAHLGAPAIEVNRKQLAALASSENHDVAAFAKQLLEQGSTSH